MRNLSEFPVTHKEIEDLLIKLSEEFNTEMRMGDMRPMLLRKAAQIVHAARHMPINSVD